MIETISKATSEMTLLRKGQLVVIASISGESRHTERSVFCQLIPSENIRKRKCANRTSLAVIGSDKFTINNIIKIVVVRFLYIHFSRAFLKISIELCYLNFYLRRLEKYLLTNSLKNR